LNIDPTAVITARDLRFAYGNSLTLAIPEFTVAKGEHAFLKGASGSGKSTLLALLTGVLTPSQGEITLLEQSLTNSSAGQRDRFRADHIGYIFQLFNLLPYLSVLDNVMLPCRFSKRRHLRSTQQQVSLDSEARRLLSSLGLQSEALLRRRVTDLSVGQQQRVAAARALIGAPELLIADEPTSSLDADNRANFIELMLRECDRNGATVLFVSHDQALGQYFRCQWDMAEINHAGAD
jgi:putative ABC transport system ATP-binding protein